jgi:hypothetical protein
MKINILAIIPVPDREYREYCSMVKFWYKGKVTAEYVSRHITEDELALNAYLLRKYPDYSEDIYLLQARIDQALEYEARAYNTERTKRQDKGF